MEKVTFLQSIIKVLNLIASIPFFIEILILTAFLLIIMIFFYFRKSKKGKITSLIIYFVTLLLLPISHFSFFVETLDKIVENFIAVIYFPSCYVYIAACIVAGLFAAGIMDGAFLLQNNTGNVRRAAHAVSEIDRPGQNCNYLEQLVYRTLCLKFVMDNNRLSDIRYYF